MTAGERSRWPIWIAWGISSLALVQVGTYWLFLATKEVPALLLALIHSLGLLGALAVVLATGWRDRAGGARWGWLLLAVALGLLRWATLLEALPATLIPLTTPWFTVMLLAFAGLAAVIGPTRLWAEQSITTGSTLQRLLESGIIGLSALLVLSSSVGADLPARALSPPLTLRLVSDGLLLGGMGMLLARRRLIGFVGLVFGCRLAAAGILVFLGTGRGAAILPLETLQGGVLALAAAYRAQPTPVPPDGVRVLERDESWRGTWLVRLVLVSGLLIAVPGPTPPMLLVLGLVAMGIAHEGCIQLRHQELQRQQRVQLQHERSAFRTARDGDQQTIQALARLIHDLGPPVQGISGIIDQLIRIAMGQERESPRTLSERLGNHADHLEHLIRQLNVRLRRESPATPRRCTVDVMVVAMTVVESLAALADPTVPLWFTEGAKKADSLATVYGEAIVPVNLNGVWGFRGTNRSGGKLVLPDVDEIAWNGRLIVLAFDSDVVRKAPVAAALRRLAALLLARGVAEVQMLVLPQVGDTKVGVDDFLGSGHPVQALEAHLTTLQSGLAQARVRLSVHPETGHDLFLPHGWSVVNGSLATVNKSGEPTIIYSGVLITSAIGVDLATGDAMLTVRWQGRGGRRDELTAPKAELGTRQGVLAWLGARPDAPVHESNARDVAAYLIEFAQENLDALPRVATSARLGLVADGLVLPAGSVGHAEPVQYAGRLPIRFGSDAEAYPQAIQAISTWPDA